MNRIEILDHGFVQLHNISGPTVYPDKEFNVDDVDPANVARMSFNNMGSDRTREQEMKLCAYLMKNWHTSPFEMVEVWLEMKLPIFVARQFVRHRTTSLNEMSGRYVTLPEEWYIPAIVGGKAANVKQGQADNLSIVEQIAFKDGLNGHCHRGYKDYLYAIKQGVAPEHARLFLSLNHYTHWMWKQDLHNLMHFLSLRDHSHAQVEAQAYAKAIDQLIRAQLPELMALYDEHRRRK